MAVAALCAIFAAFVFQAGNAAKLSGAADTQRMLLPLLAVSQSVTTPPSLGADEAPIPAGTIQMGCDPTNPADVCHGDRMPLHDVYLDAYAMDKFEVTNARYQACVDTGHCTPPYRTYSWSHTEYYGNPAFADYPVIYVEWDQAEAFCAWEGKRLPTEAEWERAARGSSDTRKYPWGNDGTTCDLANTFVDSLCVGDTSAVGSYPAGISPYGVMDMAGNVWEWTADWYQYDYYSVSPPNNPPGPATGELRVLRGGSWNDSHLINLRVAHRYWDSPGSAGANIGFRCARSLP